MKIPDKRGHWKKKVFLKNKESILAWLKENKDGFCEDCAEELGLSTRTVYSHFRDIKKEAKGQL